LVISWDRSVGRLLPSVTEVVVLGLTISGQRYMVLTDGEDACAAGRPVGEVFQPISADIAGVLTIPAALILAA
jgi:hypothetical protein